LKVGAKHNTPSHQQNNPINQIIAASPKTPNTQLGTYSLRLAFKRPGCIAFKFFRQDQQDYHDGITEDAPQRNMQGVSQGRQNPQR